MKNTLLTFLLAFSIIVALPGQSSPVCGTAGQSAASLSERLLANRAHASQQLQRRDIQYVPVKFHLVARNDGSGRVPENNVLDQLCALNADFLDMNVQFFIKEGFSYLDNTAVYENHAQTENSIMAIRRDRDALNIWIVDDATPGGSSPEDGIVYGYYSIARDWLVVRADQVNASTKVLTHEVGHFFSLLHTHNGWDGEPWSEEIHGNPAPALSPEGIPTELMDGTNCEDAGDFICDTPPDYNGLGWPNCDYTKGAQDPKGVLIDPDEANFMSYFLFCDQRLLNFSSEQKELMLVDLASVNRNFLRRDAPTNTASIDGNTQLLSPANDAEVPGGGTVLLEWAAVDDADSYVVEIDRTPAFTFDPRSVVATTNNLEVTDLVVGRRYFWRVRPYNEYDGCVEPTAARSFIIGMSTAANSIDFVENWSLSPNPARSDQGLRFELNTMEAFDGHISLFTITGQEQQRQPYRFAAGTNRVEIPIAGLNSGVYLFTLVTEAGRINQRIILTD